MGAGRGREQLVGDLGERLQTAATSGDFAGLLDAEVSGLARDLAEALTQDTGNAAAPDVVDALRVLVAVHWVRYQILPEGQDQKDLRACLHWSTVLLPVAPHFVPDPMRDYLTGPDTPAGSSAATATTQAISLYKDYQQTGNLEHLQTAVTLFRDAVATTPPDHPDRPGRLSNLGGALQVRFGRVGQQQDLDEAITVGRDAVATTVRVKGLRPSGVRVQSVGLGCC